MQGQNEPFGPWRQRGSTATDGTRWPKLLAPQCRHGTLMNDTFDKSPPENSCERQEGLLAEKRRALGEEHPATLAAMLDLADCLWAQAGSSRRGSSRSMS